MEEKSMDKLYFKNVVTVGNLYLEYILFEFENEPILFICSDDLSNTYLCVCSDFRGHMRWVVARCPVNILRMLLRRRLTINSAFRLPNNVVVIDRDNKGNETSALIDRQFINPLDLPDPEFMVKDTGNNEYIIEQLMLIKEAANDT